MCTHGCFVSRRCTDKVQVGDLSDEAEGYGLGSEGVGLGGECGDLSFLYVLDILYRNRMIIS